MQVNTHMDISKRLCGRPTLVKPGRAIVELETIEEMGTDDLGLVHGGFVFGLADYAAMLAVNDPNVVLAAAETRFVAPVTVGDVVKAEARITEEKGRKRRVQVVCSVRKKPVLMGTFDTVVLDSHVLGS